MEKKDDVIDFAIVGGGVAGTYAAWRIAKRLPDRTMHLYESSFEVGGRLLTKTVPGTQHNAELGAMRYTDKQVFVKHLVRRLGLSTRPFKYPVRLMHLRGRLFKPGATPPYRLGREERKMGPDELVKYAIRRALSEIHFNSHRLDMDQARVLRRIERRLRKLRSRRIRLWIDILLPREWDVVKRHGMLENTKLYEIGFWNLLHFYLGSEAFQFAHDGIGYESILANWNAAEAIPWFLRDFDAEYTSVDAGMQEIPERLVREVEERRPKSVYMLHVLTKVRQSPGQQGFLELHFEVGEERRPKQVTARHVILALPKGALEVLAFEGIETGGVAGPNEYLKPLLDAVTPHSLFKLFLGYDYPWWNNKHALGHLTGRTITDQPIRQVYYFEPADTRSQRAVLMASYSDAHYVDFWNPLQIFPGRDYYYEYENTEPLAPGEKEDLRLYGAIKRMVMKAHKQVVRLHPKRRRVPMPYVALAMNWSRPPYYGGWHSWNPSPAAEMTPWEVMKKLTKPFPMASLLVCGEAYSCEQGWVEGALRSAERALHTLDLGPPDIENKEYKPYRSYEEYIGFVEPGPA